MAASLHHRGNTVVVESIPGFDGESIWADFNVVPHITYGLGGFYTIYLASDDPCWIAVSYFHQLHCQRIGRPIDSGCVTHNLGIMVWHSFER